LKNDIFERGAEPFFVVIKKQYDEVGGKILLGDNTRGGGSCCGISDCCDGVCISAGMKVSTFSSDIRRTFWNATIA
jgi:hypothetical protein